ncbi:P-loop containing nucleoside triphosphate hydrolase protein [Trametes gibbosa]|nr:P-loop containing nucleoside triphosphate hydrolase protein [Trametes gibbosa]
MSNKIIKNTPQAQGEDRSSQHHSLLHSEYGKTSKELIEFVGQLRTLGAHIDLELPRIVVIGNQSAGKSSLVEAISGISVPRDAGTCTRCPMECRLSHSSNEWSCQIKIRYEYNGAGEALDEVEEIPFGPLLTDKAEVEDMLRRAQRATLFAEVEDHNVFLENNWGEKVKGQKPLRFSKNVVCVELAGPELTDLSFVDLPGIVQNAESEVVELVEEMVNSYITGTSLILVTLPMSDDIENQKAARLAYLADQKGLRTIGVLTKPDTLAAGSTKLRDMWLDVLEGRKHTLLHGYYCTRQPDDEERIRGVEGAAAREAEKTFFARTQPWAGSVHQGRFGTANLVRSISKLLTQIIRESLPQQLSNVAAQLAACRAQLDALPPAITTEPSAFVLALVTRFAADLRATIYGSAAPSGDGGGSALVQRTRRAYATLKNAVRSSAPPFVPYENASQAPKDVSSYTWAMNGKGKGKRGAPGAEPEGDVFYLEDVRRHIRASVTRELPGNVPYTAKVSLIRTFQNTWEEAALACYEEVREVFKDAIAEAVDSEFGRYANLKSIIGPVTAELMAGCAEAAIAQIRAILTLETSPFTQNGHYLAESRDKWLAKYKDARAGRGLPERVTPVSSTVGTTTSTASSIFGVPTLGIKAPESAFNFVYGSASATSRPSVSLPSKPLTPSNSKPAGHHSPKKKNKKGPYTVQPTLNWAQPSSEGDPAEEGELEPPTPSTAISQLPFHPLFSPSTPAAPTIPQPSPEEVQKKADLVTEALATLAKLGYAGLTEDDLGKLNKADVFEEEMELMAEVRAYFQVSYKRVIDYVPLTIDHHFLYAFAEKLHERLFERLGLGAHNAAARCSAYIAEDPTIVAARDELLAKKKRLENVQRALFNFGL